MKKLFALCLFCLASATAFGQGSVYSTTIFNRIGQAVPNASFAVCTAEPTGDSLCQGTSLTTTYEDITLGTPCTNVSSATGPTSGTGCTNPGLSDSLGNVIVFSTAAVRWAQISGYLITDQTLPIAFPATSTSAVAFNSITAGTNTQALRIGTGGSFAPTGTGTIQGTSLVLSNAAQISPGTVDTTGCSSQGGGTRNPLFWIKNANNHYNEWFCNDTTLSGAPTAPAGTPEFVFRTWWNSSSAAMPGGKNRFVSIYHVPGLGGVDSAAGTLDESAFSSQMSNTGAEQTFRQLITNYNELVLVGSPSFLGTAGGESNGSVFRASLSDGRTGGSATNKIFAISAQADAASSVAGAYASCGNGDCLAALRTYLSTSVATAYTGSPFFESIVAEGNNSGSATGVGYFGLHARTPATRFPLGTFGLVIDNFGTNASDYNFVSTGVNSAGTAAGFNYATGPFAFGQAIHAAAGYQVDILGAAKFKSGAGDNNACFFGSTSGSACIRAAAVQGTPNALSPPTTTATATTSGVSQAMISDGANPQQLAYQWHAPVMSASGTIQTAGKIVKGRCTLGTDCSITLTGNAVFTSSSSYECSATDTTAANAIRFNPSSGSAFALTGTGTDVLSWMCVGN